MQIYGSISILLGEIHVGNFRKFDKKYVHIWYFEITFSTDYIKSALYNGLDAIIKCSLIAQLHALGKRGSLGLILNGLFD